MLKAERKHRPQDGNGRGKRGRQIAAAALVCLAALAFSLVMLRQSSQEETTALPAFTDSTLFRNTPDEICRVTVRLAGQEPWSMQRSGDGQFQLEDEKDWTVDPLISDRITDALSHLEYTDIFSEDESEYRDRLQEFGLEDPQVTVTWSLENGLSHMMRIGDAVEPEEADCCFMLIEGDGRLYGVDNGTLQDLRKDRSLLHAVPALPLRKALIDRIAVRNGSGAMTACWELGGNITDQDAGDSWRIIAPFVYAADEEGMRNLLNSAGNLTLGTYVGQATEENLTACGLNAPDAVLEIHMAAGSTGTVTEAGVYDVTDWEEETVSLTVAEGDNGMTDYVLYDGAVYTMTHFSLSPFTEAEPMTTAARYLAVTPLESLVSLRVEEDGRETAVYELSGAADGIDAPECRKNGEPIPYESFEAAYNRLLVVTVSGMLPEGAEWGEAHTKYTFRTISGGTHTVWLSAYDALHDAVTLDGQTLFYLIRNGVTELP